jgi:hypothetical protein
MNSRYFYYALFVTVISTWNSWSQMLKAQDERGPGSSWSSGGRSYGGGSWGGGGHK